MTKSFHNKKPAEEAVVMFWQLGLDTQQIANRMGASEAGVYNVLAAWREKTHDSNHSAISPECEQALANDEDWRHV